MVYEHKQKPHKFSKRKLNFSGYLKAKTSDDRTISEASQVLKMELNFNGYVKDKITDHRNISDASQVLKMETHF